MSTVNTVEIEESPQLRYVYRRINEITNTINDYVQKFINTDITYALNIKDSFSTNSVYNAELVTKIGVKDSISYQLDTINTIKLGVYELYLNNAGMVITDIFKYNIAIDDTNFDEALSPIGFSAFREMKTGDYTYQNAICKVRLEAQNSGDRPNIRQYVHKVDVPDVVESGIITLTATNQPVTYLFKRKFHSIPEVNFSIKSSDIEGATFVPVNISTEEISIYLKSGTSYIGGQISFSARGY